MQIGDIRDKEFVENQLRDTEIVFHHAAVVSVDQSVKDPMATDECNIRGTLNVLLAARDNQVRVDYRIVKKTGTPITDTKNALSQI